MARHVTEPVIVERGPFHIVGVYATFQDDDEEPAWGQASSEFFRRSSEVVNRVGDAVLGFLYRPHRDDPSVPEDVRACFVGVEVSDFTNVPAGMATTQFSGGRFVTVQSVGDTELESALGVGDAVVMLEQWAAEHGYREGDSCFSFSYPREQKPPYVEHIYMKIE